MEHMRPSPGGLLGQDAGSAACCNRSRALLRACRAARPLLPPAAVGPCRRLPAEAEAHMGLAAAAGDTHVRGAGVVQGAGDVGVAAGPSGGEEAGTACFAGAGDMSMSIGPEPEGTAAGLLVRTGVAARAAQAIGMNMRPSIPCPGAQPRGRKDVGPDAIGTTTEGDGGGEAGGDASGSAAAAAGSSAAAGTLCGRDRAAGKGEGGGVTVCASVRSAAPCSCMCWCWWCWWSVAAWRAASAMGPSGSHPWSSSATRGSKSTKEVAAKPPPVFMLAVSADALMGGGREGWTRAGAGGGAPLMDDDPCGRLCTPLLSDRSGTAGRCTAVLLQLPSALALESSSGAAGAAVLALPPAPSCAAAAVIACRRSAKNGISRSCSAVARAAGSGCRAARSSCSRSGWDANLGILHVGRAEEGQMGHRRSGWVVGGGGMGWATALTTPTRPCRPEPRHANTAQS